MHLDSDLLIDRKRLKTRLASWRAVAFLAACGVVILLGQHYSPPSHTPLGADYIAQITIEGMMLDDPERDARIKEIANDPHAKAVLVRLDSPGGTTMAGEELFLQFRALSKKKPVVGVMRTLCASACYMASLGTDQIFARKSTLTGSIGVLLESFEVSRLADKIGVTPLTIKSGPYKDVPSMTAPFTEEQRAVLNATIMHSYDQFVHLIMERRHLDEATVRQIGDGRIYTGDEAVPIRLIDGIGGYDEALAWLAQHHRIDPTLALRESKPKEEMNLDTLLDRFLQHTDIKFFGKSSVGLDGLQSVWQGF